MDLGHLFSLSLFCFERRPQEGQRTEDCFRDLFTAKSFSTSPRWSDCVLDSQFDLETKREDGSHWGLSKDSHIEDLFSLLRKRNPSL